jgi:uncharacterized BrkB/YihY/UPF0761 family membrane protein
VHSRVAESEWRTESPELDAEGHTRPRVQVLSLCVCAVAAGAIVAAVHLPWFGSVGNDSVPKFSAISGALWRTGLVPGSQDWGYLVVAWSALLVVGALVAAFACAFRRSHSRPPLSGLLLCLALASVVLVAIVLAELSASAQFDLVSYAPSDWGAWIGLGLAVVSSFGAWFAWATWRFPHRWGLDESARVTAP